MQPGKEGHRGRLGSLKFFSQGGGAGCVFLLLSTQRTGELPRWMGSALGRRVPSVRDGPDRLPSASPAPLQDNIPSPTDAALYIFHEPLFPEKAAPCWNVGPCALGGGSSGTTGHRKLVSNPPTRHSPREAVNSRTFPPSDTDPAHACHPVIPARWQRRGEPLHGANTCTAAAPWPPGVPRS